LDSIEMEYRNAPFNVTAGFTPGDNCADTPSFDFADEHCQTTLAEIGTGPIGSIARTGRQSRMGRSAPRGVRASIVIMACPRWRKYSGQQPARSHL